MARPRHFSGNSGREKNDELRQSQILYAVNKRYSSIGAGGKADIIPGMDAKPKPRFQIQSAVIALFFVAPLVLGSDAPLWDGHESVEHYAQRVNLPPTKTLDLGNGVKLETVLIPAGKFIMGTPEPTAPGETVLVGQAILVVSGVLALGLLFVVLWRSFAKRQRPNFSLRWLVFFTFALSVGLYGGVRWHKTSQAWQEYEAVKARYQLAEPDEKPAHEVTLTRPFYMGKFDVTQEQHQQVRGTNPLYFFTGKDYPADRVSWDDAQIFCRKLTAQTKQTVRLPTEAEWEFSCRAGTSTMYYSGDTGDLDRVAWYAANSKNTAHPVGQKEANAFGLYDMHGNVFQWCEDRWQDYYEDSPRTDPLGPVDGNEHVLRGGHWDDSPYDCRSARRVGFGPGDRFYSFGFRIVVVCASSKAP